MIASRARESSRKGQTVIYNAPAGLIQSQAMTSRMQRDFFFLPFSLMGPTGTPEIA